MIDVLFFAGLKEQAGTNQYHCAASGYSVEQLKQEILRAFPNVDVSTCLVAVNESFVEDATVLVSGDTVAFIPPVSGG